MMMMNKIEKKKTKRKYTENWLTIGLLTTTNHLLLEKRYIVYGIIRRHSSINTKRIDHIYGKLKLIYGDMTDQTSLTNVFNQISNWT